MAHRKRLRRQVRRKQKGPLPWPFVDSGGLSCNEVRIDDSHSTLSGTQSNSGDAHPRVGFVRQPQVLLPMVCIPWPIDLMAFENASESMPNSWEWAWNFAMTVWNCCAPEELLLPERLLN